MTLSVADVIGAAVPKGAVTDALYWDNEDPYHYVRLDSRPAGADDILLVGGGDHKTGQHPDGAARTGSGTPAARSSAHARRATSTSSMR